MHITNGKAEWSESQLCCNRFGKFSCSCEEKLWFRVLDEHFNSFFVVLLVGIDSYLMINEFLLSLQVLWKILLFFLLYWFDWPSPVK